jgi:putative NADH-flavin reductase
MSSLKYSLAEFANCQLLNRGHSVTGISRNPGSIGTHKRYKPVSLNVFEAPTEEFAAALRGYDAVIWYLAIQEADNSTFGPHTGHVVTYVPFVEGMRKIVLAVKAAVIPYFVMIGGTGSTILKSEGINCCDSKNFWVKVLTTQFVKFSIST